MHRQLDFRKARAGQVIIRPTNSTLSTCSGQKMTVEGCTWLTATANNVTIRAKFLVARGITEQVLLSCDDLINLLIVHKELPNRTVTCRSCTEVGRHEVACTGRREEQTKGRPQTLRETHKGTEPCNALERSKSRSVTRAATRDKAPLQMRRKTKAGLKDELIAGDMGQPISHPPRSAGRSQGFVRGRFHHKRNSGPETRDAPTRRHCIGGTVAGTGT